MSSQSTTEKSNARAEAPGAEETTKVCKTGSDCPAQNDGAQVGDIADAEALTAKSKAFCTQLGGYELTCADDCAGPFRISRWNLSIDLPDLAAVADWLEKATGRRAD